ncbi:MAG: type 1 glutamine amidotransferase domain-containing protein [Rhodothermales bacterium]|nr:type 1 glutamine amidotransferase domain-containing protein [Rhodothermales bacterium]
MKKQLDGMKVALLATTGFEQAELTEPRKALDEAGATTHLVSLEDGTIRAWDGDDWGDTFDVDRALGAVTPAGYDALVLPGGQMNPDFLRADDDAVAFVRAFFDAGKPVAAICHGPWTLIEAGVVEGRRMTSYHSIQTDLKNAGADWVDEAPVTDGNLVTARNPDDLPGFNEAMLKLFAESRTLETA